MFSFNPGITFEILEETDTYKKVLSSTGAIFYIKKKRQVHHQLNIFALPFILLETIYDYVKQGIQYCIRKRKPSCQTKSAQTNERKMTAVKTSPVNNETESKTALVMSKQKQEEKEAPTKTQKGKPEQDEKVKQAQWQKGKQEKGEKEKLSQIQKTKQEEEKKKSPIIQTYSTRKTANEHTKTKRQKRHASRVSHRNTPERAEIKTETKLEEQHQEIPKQEERKKHLVKENVWTKRSKATGNQSLDNPKNIDSGHQKRDNTNDQKKEKAGLNTSAPTPISVTDPKTTPVKNALTSHDQSAAVLTDTHDPMELKAADQSPLPLDARSLPESPKFSLSASPVTLSSTQMVTPSFLFSYRPPHLRPPKSPLIKELLKRKVTL